MSSSWIRLKRVIDLIVSLLALIALSPILLIVASAVALTSPGGALFVQQRVGRNERPFNCIKFRSMKRDAPIGATHQVSKDWVTPVGRFLRRTKFDELPQLYNVLTGDMSMVGPRPCLPSQGEVIKARRSRAVFSIRPGITGLAQVLGVDMSKPETLAKIDQQYVRRSGSALDALIVWRTIWPRKQAGKADAA